MTASFILCLHIGSNRSLSWGQELHLQHVKPDSIKEYFGSSRRCHKSSSRKRYFNYLHESCSLFPSHLNPSAFSTPSDHTEPFSPRRTIFSHSLLSQIRRRVCRSKHPVMYCHVPFRGPRTMLQYRYLMETGTLIPTVSFTLTCGKRFRSLMLTRQKR